MSKKLYVGNLPYGAAEDDLREVFEKIGEVQSVKIVTDPATGRSRGFGFVEMASNEDADRAIATLNGTKVMERAIIVSEARPQAAKGGGRPGQGRSFDRGKGTGRWR